MHITPPYRESCPFLVVTAWPTWQRWGSSGSSVAACLFPVLSLVRDSNKTEAGARKRRHCCQRSPGHPGAHLGRGDERRGAEVYKRLQQWRSKLSHVRRYTVVLEGRSVAGDKILVYLRDRPHTAWSTERHGTGSSKARSARFASLPTVPFDSGKQLIKRQGTGILNRWLGISGYKTGTK